MIDQKENLLQDFMEEFFDFDGMVEMKVFTPEMKGDYQAQADKICYLFGFESIYEYGSKEVRCHLTCGGDDQAGLGLGDRKGEPFVTVIPSIYE